MSFLKILTLSLITSNGTLTLLTLYWKANITRNARLHKLHISFYERKFEIHIMQIWNLNLHRHLSWSYILSYHPRVFSVEQLLTYILPQIRIASILYSQSNIDKKQSLQQKHQLITLLCWCLSDDLLPTTSLLLKFFYLKL